MNIKNLLKFAYYRLLVFFEYKLDKSKIPSGHYCYVPDDERNKNACCDDINYYIQPCPYYLWINKRYKACIYCGKITDDFLLSDQCKICNVNED